MKYTPELVADLEKNEVYVYDSNQYARHTVGSGLTAAHRFGALVDVAPMGLVGQSYGIITMSYSDERITTGFIGDQVLMLYKFAMLRQDLTFYVTKVGTGIAGFSMAQIADIFYAYEFMRPVNIILPIEFSTPKA